MNFKHAVEAAKAELLCVVVVVVVAAALLCESEELHSACLAAAAISRPQLTASHTRAGREGAQEGNALV